MPTERDWEHGWDRARAAAYWSSPEYDEYCFRPSGCSALDPLTAVYGDVDAYDTVAEREPGKYFAGCPAHEDDTASLRITVKESGKVLLYCFAGCDTGDVLEALGLGWAALMPVEELA